MKRQPTKRPIARQLTALAFIAMFHVAATAQPVVSASPPIPALMRGALAWSDYNGNGTQDLLICGEDSAGRRHTYLLQNTGATLIPDNTQALAQVAMGDAAWGDLDGDGDRDLVLTGELAPRQAITHVYKNVGGNLQLQPTPSLPGLSGGRVVVADLDGDSDLDIFLTGYNVIEGFVGMIARNDGLGAFGTVTDAAFGTREWTSVGVGDYDQDGLADIAFADVSPELAEGMRVVILHNDGGLHFSPATHFIPGFYAGNLDFADADADGDLDLLCSGMGVAPLTAWYKYEAGQFQPTTTTLTPLGLGEARWVDFDADGNIDILACGRTSTTVQTIAYKQTNGTFSQIQGPGGMPRLYHARMAFADWNGDGHPDLAITGQDENDQPASYIATWNTSIETFEF